MVRLQGEPRISSTKPDLSFNSKMVRLQVYCHDFQPGDNPEFQFQNGAIARDNF